MPLITPVDMADNIISPEGYIFRNVLGNSSAQEKFDQYLQSSDEYIFLRASAQKSWDGRKLQSFIIYPKEYSKAM